MEIATIEVPVHYMHSTYTVVPATTRVYTHKVPRINEFSFVSYVSHKSESKILNNSFNQCPCVLSERGLLISHSGLSNVGAMQRYPLSSLGAMYSVGASKLEKQQTLLTEGEVAYECIIFI